MQRHTPKILGLYLILAAVLVLSLNGTFLSPASMAVGTPFPTWTRELPATFTPTLPPPTATESVHSSDWRTIWLLVSLDPQWLAGHDWHTLQTVVQWQDRAGDWHDVAGWRGPLDGVSGHLGWKPWAFPATMSGSGPFRWRVCAPATERAGFSWCVTSESFTLPYVERRIPLEIPPSP